MYFYPFRAKSERRSAGSNTTCLEPAMIKAWASVLVGGVAVFMMGGIVFGTRCGTPR